MTADAEPPATSAADGVPFARAARLTRPLWLALGCILVVLGAIGAVLPLMPTTIFLILAAGCFARSSPRLERALLDHPRIGPGLRAWRRDGAIAARAKAFASLGMTVGYASFWWIVRPGVPLALGVAAGMAGCAAFVLTRPTATV